MAPLDIVAGRGRSRAARRRRDSRGSGDLARGGHAARADLESDRSARLLEHAPRAGRRGRRSSRSPSTSTPPCATRSPARTDLIASRKQIEANDISIRYFRNQSLPDVNALVNYSAIGLAGTQFDFGQGFPAADARASTQRGFFGALGDAFASDFPTWSLQLQVNYPIGASNAEANLARARLQNTQAQKQLQSPELQIDDADPQPRAERADQREACRSRRARRARSPRSGSKRRRRSSRPA